LEADEQVYQTQYPSRFFRLSLLNLTSFLVFGKVTS
jgi:hypothetical protein